MMSQVTFVPWYLLMPVGCEVGSSGWSPCPQSSWPAGLGTETWGGEDAMPDVGPESWKYVARPHFRFVFSISIDSPPFPVQIRFPNQAVLGFKLSFSTPTSIK